MLHPEWTSPHELNTHRYSSFIRFSFILVTLTRCWCMILLYHKTSWLLQCLARWIIKKMLAPLHVSWWNQEGRPILKNCLESLRWHLACLSDLLHLSNPFQKHFSFQDTKPRLIKHLPSSPPPFTKRLRCYSFILCPATAHPTDLQHARHLSFLCSRLFLPAS